MLTVRLLGRPEIARDGATLPPPRGRKAWAVLAYVLLAERPVARATLAELLFAGAGDPLGALRWTLAQLRRALGPDTLRGDPIEPGLSPGSEVDVAAIAAPAPDLALIRGELLEGADPDAGAVFAAWLLVERRRLAGIGQAVLHDAALEALTAGRPLDGARLASRGLELDPYDESTHELLVRCLARAGQRGAARHHANACAVLFRRELGRDPDPRVIRAAGEGAAEAETPATGDRAAALAQLAAGRAALAAGAVEPGIACLAQAAAEARAVGDPGVLARVLAAHGAALVHAVRGRDEEGAAVLHEALALAEAAGEGATAAAACRELGFVDVQAARGVSAVRWLSRAGELAEEDRERAATLGVRGMALSDRAHYEPALALLDRSVALAERAGDARQAAWSLALAGRARVLRGELAAATPLLDRSLALVEDERWVAFRPFPDALRAEVELLRGDPAAAAGRLEAAFALSCRLGDPCWESLAARGRGLAHLAAHDHVAALAWLREAALRANRVSDPYVWMHAHCLEALARAEILLADPAAEARVAELERVAAHGDLRELVVRAALLRARLGDPCGLAAARLLGETIDNPVLDGALAAA